MEAVLHSRMGLLLCHVPIFRAVDTWEGGSVYFSRASIKNYLLGGGQGRVCVCSLLQVRAVAWKKAEHAFSQLKRARSWLPSADRGCGP